MSHASSPPSTPPFERLAGAPVAHRDGQWWLVSGSEAIRAVDPDFAGELDRFAAAMAAATQAVALMKARRRPGDDREPQ